MSYKEQIMFKDKFTRIFFVTNGGYYKDVSISLLSDLFKGNKKKQFNKEQILKVNGLVQTGKGKLSFSFRETNKCFLLIM